MPFIGKHLAGPPRTGPVVSVRHRDVFELDSVHFATKLSGSTAGEDFFFMFREKSSHHKKPGADLQNLGIGDKITKPEWIRKKPSLPDGQRLPVCLKKDGKLRCIAKFGVPTLLMGKELEISVAAKIPGLSSFSATSKRKVTFPKTHTPPSWVKFEFSGKLPNSIARNRLSLIWKIAGHEFAVFENGSWTNAASVETKHVVYTIFERPFLPEIPSRHFEMDAQEGTLTGTEKRFDILMKAFGSDLRHDASDDKAKMEICWKLHKHINDNNPPYFHGGNHELLTTEAFPDFVQEDMSTWPENKHLWHSEQWLMWAESKREKAPFDPKAKKKKKKKRIHRRWNDASCIGHAQLQKTMMASIGLFGHLAWVFPHTTRLPDSGTDPTGKNSPKDVVTFADRDLYRLGYEKKKFAKLQLWKFVARLKDKDNKLLDPIELDAAVVLMHGDAVGFEIFEGCFLTDVPELGNDGKRFLTGGYTTPFVAAKHKDFKKNKGFLTATELLSWWIRSAQGRFLVWTTVDPRTDFRWFFDKKGNPHHRAANIRKKNLQLEWKP